VGGACTALNPLWHKAFLAARQKSHIPDLIESKAGNDRVLRDAGSGHAEPGAPATRRSPLGQGSMLYWMRKNAP
jgi:hypothetical protein